MTNMLSEINRVREIMGVNVIQEQIDADRVVPSSEILAWAKEEISWRESEINDGVEEDGYTQADLDRFTADILELQQDPVSVVQEDKDRYCKWVEEGDNHWVDSCQEMTELLKTVNINTTSTGDENTIVEPPKNKEKEKKEKVKKEKVKKEKKKKVKKPTSRQMAKELKSAWKTEVFQILDNIQEGDVFGFGEAYSLQKNDKLHAILKMLQNLMCVNAKIARTVILAEDNVYEESKLMSTAQFPKGRGHEGLIGTIENNIERLDKKFKLGRGGMKVDRKLRPIKKQLRQAREFINTLTPYLNWDEAGDVLGFDARTTEDILINSTNLNKIHRRCANAI